jgi:microcystin-dependent protein
MLGSIIIFAGNFEPMYCAYCDGRKLSIQQNTALFSILGTTYGGDGTTNFLLPDLRPIDKDGKKRNWNAEEPKYLIITTGSYPVRP